MAKKHIVQIHERYAQLTRNATYKKDAYEHMKGLGIYDAKGTILGALKDRESAMCQKHNMDADTYRNRWTGGLTPEERAEKYKISYTHDDGRRNFGWKSASIAGHKEYKKAKRKALSAGKSEKEAKRIGQQAREDYYARTGLKSEGGVPYPHQAHHVLPCEVFYDDKWYEEQEDAIMAYLDVVMMSDYNINAPENIIYLPQLYGDDWYCKIHNLPNHADKKGHDRYNEQAVDACDEVYDMIDKVVFEPCEEREDDLIQQIKDKLVEIQEKYYNHCKTTGPGPLW